MSLIDIKDVYKIYNEGRDSEVRALNGVSLQIDRREFVAIIGASGSGKSTLMNVLGCLDIPTYGEYTLDGEEITEMNDHELSRIRNKEIGFIFQGFNLIDDLTALENVELPLIYRGTKPSLRRELAEKALDRVGLSKRMQHYPKEMSGGQQQRVAIARALASRPPIILADEPTGNLDSHTSADVMALLRELHADGSTVILITHDDGIAASAERVVRIIDGKIVSDSASDAGEGTQ
ncbi:MAG: ABC transporter ATP-binding protein [Oscillospiraceae bacterium]|nr:ABC transporter ATP-binding protein [Oscillospiraceae bacterium]